MPKKANTFKDILAKRLKNVTYELTTLDDEDNSPIIVTNYLTTGSMALDWVMGSGLPSGRIVELYGEESSGKSLIAYQVVVSALERDMDVLYIDSEHAVSDTILTNLGVDKSRVTYADPDVMEEVFELMETAMNIVAEDDNHPGLLIVWDSIAATSVKMEQEADYGKSTMGRHANVMSQGLRKLTGLISQTQTYALFINQTRENIGVMFGDKVSTFGGKALKFHASIRIQLYKPKKIKAKKRGQIRVIGADTKALCVKNKLSPPYREANLPIYFGHGINDEEALYSTLKVLEIIKVSGPSNTLLIDKEQVKFLKKDWPNILDTYYEEIETELFKEPEEYELVEGEDD